MELVVRRAIAFFFDCALMFAVLWPIGLLVQKVTGLKPEGGMQVWYTLLLNFSLPVWIYFTLSDASRSGASVGKKWMKISVHDAGGAAPPSIPRAFVRTAVKLLPWELVHISAFALSNDFAQFTLRQTLGITVANGLFIGYAVLTIASGGRRSIHDFAVNTAVDPRVGGA